jgi:hypothetical protein
MWKTDTFIESPVYNLKRPPCFDPPLCHCLLIAQVSIHKAVYHSVFPLVLSCQPSVYVAQGPWCYIALLLRFLILCLIQKYTYLLYDLPFHQIEEIVWQNLGTTMCGKSGTKWALSPQTLKAKHSFLACSLPKWSAHCILERAKNFHHQMFLCTHISYTNYLLGKFVFCLL